MLADQGRSISCRRQFLLAIAGIASTSLCGNTALGAGTEGSQQESVSIRPAGKGLYRVRIELEVEGNVNVPKDPLISRKGELKLPIRSDAVFDFEERYRLPGGLQTTADANPSGYVTMLDRYYHQAESNSELNRRKKSVSLRDSVRATIVRRERLPEVIYGVEDYFERDELELLRTPVSSAAIDELLPTDSVQVGDKYSPSASVMMSVLNLSAVQSTDLVAEVVEIQEANVRIQFRGDVQGSVDGIPTIVRVAGKLMFDRKLETCTWLAMAIHETREVGKAEPGFDVAGTIKMIREPISELTALSKDELALDVNAAIPEDRLFVDIHSDQLGIRMLMDRDWRMMTDIPGTAMMRMIDDEISVAQCDFRPLATLQAGQQWTLEAFQKDVQRTLGEQLTELVGADQQVSDAGLRVLRVTAAGAVEGVPIQWVVLHFSDDSGRRLLATFTMEADHVDAFARADEQLVSSLRIDDTSLRNDQGLAAGDQSVLKVAEKPADVQSASDK